MPITPEIDVGASDRVSLEEFKELYRDAKFDASDPESLIEVASLMGRLNKDRTFLADIIQHELKNSLGGQLTNGYGSQVVTLGYIDKDTMMRANFWPSAIDEEYLQSPDSFIYGLAHDHNFNFLTVGYWGPGYKSRYFEYEYDQVDGYVGEAVALRETEQQTLSPGKVMLYRAHKDVHSQILPDEMSVTINVMDHSGGVHYREQYIFDDRVEKIQLVSNARCSINVFDIAAALCGDNGRDILDDISQKHDSDFVRFHAIRAMVKAAKDDESRLERLEAGLTSDSVVVSRFSRRYAEMWNI